MAHQTLYRTFRPKTFTDVSGQPQVTEVLEKQIEKKMPAQAYLFCGTRGTGKTTTARILANALNCLSPVNGNPCGKCEVCRSFQNGTFADVIEIDAASNNGVDNIRDIREKASLLPISGKYKVYIIDEVHMLSTGAFNALLKTLEEPPAHAVFILATTEFRKIPKTIVSRCQRYDFRRITEEDITARLKYVADAIEIKYDPAALELLASQAEGALRDALSLMDQCIAGGKTLTKDDVRSTLGLSDDELMAALCDSIMGEDAAGALSACREITEGGTSPTHILQDTISELSRRLSQNAANANLAGSILRSLEILIASQGTLRYSPAPSAVLTAALVRAALTSTDTNTKDLELRLRKVEEKVERLGSGLPVQAASPARQTGANPRRAAVPQAARTARAAPAPSGEGAAAEPDGDEKSVQGAGAVDKLAELKEQLKAKSDALVPPANALAELEERPGLVILRAPEHDLVIAELLQMPTSTAEVTAVLETVFGKPAPRLEIELFGGKAPETQEDESDGIKADLEDYMGAENVEITDLGEEQG